MTVDERELAKANKVLEWLIRELAARQVPTALIARRCAMPVNAVEAIIKGRPWRHLAAAEPRAIRDLFKR